MTNEKNMDNTNEDLDLTETVSIEETVEPEET
jgi:hypothetical protein